MAPQPLHFEREHGEKDQNIDKGDNYEESDPKKENKVQSEKLLKEKKKNTYATH